MGVLVAGGLTGLMNQPSAQVIDGSLKFVSGSSNNLNRTPSSAGNRKTWTWSAWVKRGLLGTAQYLFYCEISSSNFAAVYFTGSDTNKLTSYLDGTTGGAVTKTTDAVFRDCSAWHHVVWSVDSTQATAANRVKIYVNGVLQTTTGSDISQNDEFPINSTTNHGIGARTSNNTLFLDAHLSQVYLIDGAALGPENFGYTDPLTNTWRPKKYEGTFGIVGDYAISGGSNYLNREPADMFDGSTSTYWQAAASGDRYQLMTFPTPKTGTTIELSVLASNGWDGFEINGSVPSSLPGVGSQSWFNITTHTSGSLSSIRIAYTSGMETQLVYALRIDGTIVTGQTERPSASNSFYLPMDGNSPIGEDKSGQGNNWTQVNFGSSVGLDKATGALPILNTVSGGNHATVGVRTDANAANLVLAVPLVGSATDVSNSINSGTTTKTITVSGATASTAESNIYGGSFVFDGSNDEITVGGVSTDLDFGTGDYTAEAWFRLTGTGDEYIISMGTDHGGAAPHWGINIYSTNLIRAGRTNSGGDTNHYVTHPFITNKWYHVAISRSGGVSRLFLDGNLLDEGSNTDDIDPTTDLKIGRYGPGAIYYNGYIQDVRIYKGVGKYTKGFNPPSTKPDILPDTPSGVSGSSKLTKITDGAVSFDGSGDFLGLANTTDTNFGSGDFTVECFAYFKDVSGSHTLLGQWENGSNRRSWLLQVNSGQLNSYLSADGTSSGQKSIDSAAGAIGTNRWYHLTYARSGDTMRMFIDGILVGSVDVSGFTNYANTNDGFQVGSQKTSASNVMNGFISNARIIKGTALYTANFTPPTRELTNVTNTKLLCCQSPTSATEGAVKPGTITANGDATATNFNPFNTDINTVRGQETGYATWNPLAKSNDHTLSNGNLDSSFDGATPTSTTTGTISMSFGKFYWESTLTAQTGSGSGVAGLSAVSSGMVRPGNDANTWIYSSANGNIYHNNSNSSYGNTYAVGDVIGTAFDADNGNLYFYKNGVIQNSGTAAATGLTSGPYFPAIGDLSVSNTFTASTNFGQKPFKFPPPAGFQPLNGANVRPVKVFARPDQYVGATIYDGNGGTKNVSTNHSPDLVWIKHRTRSQSHVLYDSVRTAGTGKALASNSTGAEGAQSDGTTYGYLSAFNNNGFTVIKGSDGEDYVNKNATSYVAWSWKAGGNKNTFNVDDVGYANASDVNMNVGGSNSSVYNQSEVWSGYTKTGTQPAGAEWTEAFNGNLTNGVYPDTNVTTTLTIDVSDRPTWSSSIRIYGVNYGGVVTINGTNVSSATSGSLGWFDLTSLLGSSGTLASFSLTNPGGNYAKINAVELDGRLLIDTGVSVTNVPSIAATGASVGTRQGFSIIKYTGNSTANATLPHGLSEAPKFVIIKNLSNTYGWAVLHTDAGTTGTTLDGSPEYYMLQLDVNAGRNNFSQDTIWNPTSTTVKIDQSGGANWVNNSNSSYIAYLWHDVPGLQKFGTYEGNGSTDGPYVELGFKPALLIVKNIDDTENWYIYDPKRSPSNVAYQSLQASSGGAEETSSSNTQIDLLSNGFKLRQSNGPNNANTYIYAAWAEVPAFGLYGSQSNAR